MKHILHSLSILKVNHLKNKCIYLWIAFVRSLFLVGLVSHHAQVGATLQLWLLSSCDCSSFRGFSFQWFLLLWSMWARGLRSCSSQALELSLSSVAWGLSCSTLCEIFSGQGSNLCLLHWHVDWAGKPKCEVFWTIASHIHFIPSLSS